MGVVFCLYFVTWTNQPPASPDEARLSDDLHRLAGYMQRAQALAKTYATFQMQ